MRAIPKIAVDFVATHEGCKLKAYPDSVGVWTIGYGHTEGVSKGDTCTKAQALEWLAEDMQIAVRKLYGVLKPNVIDSLNDHQWSALLSFAFNVGAAKGWTIWKRVNAGQFDQVPAELMRFVNADGKRLPGLVGRRADEAKLWEAIDPGDKPPTPPSSVTREVGMTPPTPTETQSLAKSKTIWTGAAVSAGGAIQAAQQIQSLAAPQAANSDWIQKVVAFTAFVIVAGGVAIMVFRWLDHRNGAR